MIWRVETIQLWEWMNTYHVRRRRRGRCGVVFEEDRWMIRGNTKESGFWEDESELNLEGRSCPSSIYRDQMIKQMYFFFLQLFVCTRFFSSFLIIRIFVRKKYHKIFIFLWYFVLFINIRIDTLLCFLVQKKINNRFFKIGVSI